MQSNQGADAPEGLRPQEAAEPIDTLESSGASQPARLAAAAAAATSALLAACGGSGSEVGAAAQAVAAPSDAAAQAMAQLQPSKQALAASKPGPTPTPPPVANTRDAARFLTQATMGPKSLDEISAMATKGHAAWLAEQFALPAYNHSAYIESQRGRDDPPGATRTVSEEMSYEAVWQQWLFSEDQLRSRVTWALMQIFVISNIAPDIRAVAMSSYLDMLNRNAFGNFRQLLQGVALHPAMGHYLNMLESEKENPARGTHPNENFAREVQQLFSIGLVKLNLNGSPMLDGNGRSIPTYDEDVVKGFAKAFSGWSFGGLNNANAGTFHGHNKNDENLWRVPMIAWQMWHSTGTKQLLDGRVLPAGQTAERDLSDALDNLFMHANVGPFIGRQLIQRLVTSNPSPAYIARVAGAFNNNGAGVRGDMQTVIKAILLDTEARTVMSASSQGYGKQREPVVRLANFLRGLGATSVNGRNSIHYLDDPDEALGQSPLLAPSVFNFYSPNFRPAGPVAAAGLVAPEFQITSEISIAGSLNYFASIFDSGGVGNGDSRLRLNTIILRGLAQDSAALIDHIDRLFFCNQMGSSTRERMRSVVDALPLADRARRVRAALLLTAMAPDFVIQK